MGPRSCCAPLEIRIPGVGFLHYIVFWGTPRGVLILVARALLCSGSCLFLSQKTLIFKKWAYRRNLYFLHKNQFDEMRPDSEPAAGAGEDTAPEAAAARASRHTDDAVFHTE